MATNPSYIIEVKNADIIQEQSVIIENISFNIKPGEFVYIIGKTGSGKSSILRTLYADLALQRGEMSVVGYAIHQLLEKEVPFLRRKLGIIFQDFELFTDRTVEENLTFVMKATGWKDPALISERVAEVLGKVGLEGTQKKMPFQLSGGEQQRVAIARALINQPMIVMADEPTGNLDPVVANQILDLFREINEQTGTTVLMATHHHGFLKRHPARVLYCDNRAVKDVQKELVIKKLSGE